MSQYYLQPSIKSWKDILNPFQVLLIAYDEEGKRINRKQLYIVYDITTDGSVPDLENNGQKLYPNEDGVIELYLGEKCRISMDVYMTSLYDENIEEAEEYICEHICENLLLPFEPYIKEFSAQFISKNLVAVNSKIPRKQVQVTLHKSDGSVARFTIAKKAYDNYMIEPEIMPCTGDNSFKVSYYDTLLEKTWEYDIIVTGKVQEISIYSLYLGEEKTLESLIPKTDVSIKMIVFDGYKQMVVPLTTSEWEFTSFPQITNLNLGNFIIEHNGLRCSLTVPFKWITYKHKLDAWYEGYPVIVGHKIVPDDFRIYLYDDTGLRKMLRFDYCQIEPNDFTIHNVGLNWYDILYRVGSFTLRDKVAIIGYEEIQYPSDEYKMFYLDPEIKSYRDVTEDYDECTTIAGRRYFNWSKILDRTKELRQYGSHMLYAPVLTGLSTRSDTEWIIEVDNKKAIKARLNRIYVEEQEDLNGKNN